MDAVRDANRNRGDADDAGDLGELFTEERSAEVVCASLAAAPDARVRQVLESLVRHLHSFVKDVELTEREWQQAIAFLTATGHQCDDTRQEFILLSDVLGVSMLVETINHRASGRATESTVTGPFHVVDSPPRELGADLSLPGSGERCLVTGRVVGPDGQPVPGAAVDVWHADAEGFYDVQRPDPAAAGSLRGLFTADDQGRFWFRTVVPRYYPIPVDGPVGRLLEAMARHPYRPAHIHFMVKAHGYAALTTHLFVDDSPYLDSDAVFGVKQSLVRAFPAVDDPDRARALGLPNPFRSVDFEISLQPAGDDGAGTTSTGT
jgi:protocatechuate 3,4-dioxygenase beta subunit